MANTFMDRLAEYGVDIPKTLERFVGDVNLYKTCFTMLIGDQNMEALGKCIADSDYDGAFQAAHALKGIVGNLGLDPLYDKVNAVVEALRNNGYDELQGQYDVLAQEFAAVQELL